MSNPNKFKLKLKPEEEQIVFIPMIMKTPGAPDQEFTYTFEVPKGKLKEFQQELEERGFKIIQ